MDRKQLAAALNNLVIFKNLRAEPLVSALSALLSADEASAYPSICAVARELYPRGEDLSSAVLCLACDDENDYIKNLVAGRETPAHTSQWALRELEILSEASSFSSAYFAELFGLSEPVPGWEAEKRDFAELYHAQVRNAASRGYGMFAGNVVFTVSAEGELVTVNNPDPQRLGELCGYERERESIILNTQALLNGLSANNVLLYGDAGTGKSSTVKAIANEYAERGLRLIQVEKSLLHCLPALLDTLADNPLKFIIFIDDLSFAETDRDFTALKTILEGSVAARAKNTVVYATSNRRHLVRESNAERRGDDIHLGDTLEESASLSARFGIVVTFTRPDRDEYLTLVKSIAQRNCLALTQKQLTEEAENYALRAGGRSPRVAKQYIEYKTAMLQMEI